MVKSNETVLPLEQVVTHFLSGTVTLPELSEKLIQRVFMDDTLIYGFELNKAQALLNVSEVFIGRHVINVTTREPVSDLTLMLMIRFINVCHHGKHPIVINGEAVFTPVLLEGFDQSSVLRYIGSNLMN